MLWGLRPMEARLTEKCRVSVLLRDWRNRSLGSSSQDDESKGEEPDGHALFVR